MNRLDSAAIVGAGTMGSGIAQVLAAHGVSVTLCDSNERLAEVGVARAHADLARRRDSRLLDADVASRATRSIHSAASIVDAVRECDLVIEAVPEHPDLKVAVWRTIGAAAPTDALLTSNTSSFDIDTLAAAAGAPERFAGMHWYNPPYLVPCVELIKGTATDQAYIAALDEALRRFDKVPVVVANRAGFVGNRIQFAMIAEAFRCLDDQLASAHDIDLIVRTSFGFRLADYGPFEVADMAGLDVYRSILEYLTEHLGERFSPPPALQALTDNLKLGLKTGGGVYDWPTAAADDLRARRDERLHARLGVRA